MNNDETIVDRALVQNIAMKDIIMIEIIVMLRSNIIIYTHTK